MPSVGKDPASMSARQAAKSLAATIVKYPNKDCKPEIEELQKLMEGISHLATLRFCDSVILEASAYMKKQEAPIDEEGTEHLIGKYNYDSIVYDPMFKDPYKIDRVLKKGADPHAKDFDKFGFTMAHLMAYGGDTHFHTESWHMDRMHILRKRGCDLRCTGDSMARASLLVGLEQMNVLFVKAIIRVEMGEQWTSSFLKRVPAYAPSGKLMSALLNKQKKGAASRGRRKAGSGSAQDERLQELFAASKDGRARPLYRLWSGGWFSAHHRAAIADDETAILIFHHIGLPVNLSNKIERKVKERTAEEKDIANEAAVASKSRKTVQVELQNFDANVLETCENIDTAVTETPLMTAVSYEAVNAVRGLLKCKADPFQKNSDGSTPFSLAQKMNNKSILELFAEPDNHPITETDILPFKAAFDNRFDAVDAVATLIEKGVIECSNIEDVCGWYRNFGTSSWERVAGFWKYFSQMDK